jgi:hypothetical protein
MFQEMYTAAAAAAALCSSGWSRLKAIEASISSSLPSRAFHCTVHCKKQQQHRSGSAMVAAGCLCMLYAGGMLLSYNKRHNK